MQSKHIIFLTLLTLTVSQPIHQPSFRDVTTAAGLIQPGRRNKFGGPCVADIDNDGIYDLILTYHASAPLQIFYGTPRGTFVQANFTLKIDIHGVAVAQRTAVSSQRLIAVSVGGARGSMPRPPFIYEISPNRTIVEVTNRLGFGRGRGRGRVAIFMDLALQSRSERRMNLGGPDVLFVNFLGEPTSGLQDFAYRNVRGRYSFRRVPVIEDERETRAEVADIDGDGRMEVISFRDFQIYKLVGPFRFVDATADLVQGTPVPLNGRSIASVVEVDFDNDGDFDIYVARTNNTFISRIPQIPNDDFSDVLLENRNGTLVDVTRSAGIRRGTLSMGVTAGDFNNDGNIDLMLSMWNSRDIILLNNGDRTFTTVRTLLPRRADDIGDHAVAVDYDMDGRLDLVAGRGSQEGFTGTYHLFRNVMTRRADSGYLLVRVLNDPRRSSTSLHAVVIVFVGQKRYMRRVGGSGSQAGGPSYLDTVHFGIGGAQRIRRVRVRWSSGVQRSMTDVAVNQKITFGVE